ncbi:NAD-dependent epimerase/dehydratase family protein [Embleya scabrispora]|uniref:NAD-dependent epimerase/dehydratase family protein n=1 Tax=Embleya scabrispora TaxID=159449 RepID=UPI001374B962|nr:NAD-dependent epimerase/dehydratase family protein [Embleya scabrispora]
MKVLLTGSEGFVGRHLRRALEERGDDVTGVDLGRGLDCIHLFRRGDHRKPTGFPDLPTRYDLAIHCAAIVGGRQSIDGSPLSIATNLALDAWFFRWLVDRHGARRAVYFSSSAAYPVALQDPEGRALTESDIDLADPQLPDQTYGWAKLTGEQLAAHAEAAGTRVHVFRPFSGYGTDQDNDYPFRAFVDRARRQADPFTIWGDGNQVRDWIHIDDVVTAVLTAVDQDVPGPVNLSTGRATSFNDLADMIIAEYGYRPAIRHELAAPRGVAYRVGDPTRMKTFHTPRVSLEEGIRRALANR